MGMRDGERKSVEMKPEEGRGGLVGSVTSISFYFRFFRPGLREVSARLEIKWRERERIWRRKNRNESQRTACFWGQ